MSGLCCATLVAFSHGVILQSYIVRNYSLFLFCLSLSLYAYLRWKDARNPAMLCGYCLAAAATCSVHFSGIFGIFAIALYEMLRLLKSRAPLATLAPWASANMVPALLSIGFYISWKPALMPFAGVAVTRFSHADLLLTALFYPVMLAESYLLPSPEALLILAFCMPVAAMGNKCLQSLLCLAGVAFLLGMLLMAFGVYTVAFSRHGLWLLPFLIVPGGIAVGLCCERLAQRLVRYRPYGWNQWLMIALLLLGIASYDARQRLGAQDEYEITRRDWEKLQTFLQSLPQGTVIVTDRGSAFMLQRPGQNAYKYFPSNPFRPDGLAIMPLYHTQAVFTSSYFHLMHMTDIVSFPAAEKWLASADNLVFIATGTQKADVSNLTLCDALEKAVVTFPAIAQAHRLSSKEIIQVPVIAITIPRKTFFADFLSPQGKAHGCMR